MSKMFRFQDLEIWREAIQIGVELSRLADGLEEKRRYKWAEQLRGAALSISNNIAEGAGSASDKEFAQFLNFAKRSAFEDANMLFFFNANGVLHLDDITPLLERLEIICRKIQAFRKTLSC